MAPWRKARASIALAAAYALALQSVLFALGSTGAAAPGATPLCSTFGAGNPGPAPSGHGPDCLGICLTGCCCAGAVLPRPVLGNAPDRALALTALAAATLHVLRWSTRANRSRAPPAG